MIKVIAIDFGGVYYTWNFKKYISEISKASGIPKEQVKEIEHKHVKDFLLGKLTEKQYLKFFLEKTTVSEKVLLKVIDNHFKPIKGVVNQVLKLRKKYKLVLLTNQTKALDRYNKIHKFYDHFDLILNSSKLGVMKPNKKIYQILIKKTSVKPSEIAFIDDTKKNVEVANEMGIKSHRYKNIPGFKAFLKKNNIKP